MARVAKTWNTQFSASHTQICTLALRLLKNIALRWGLCSAFLIISQGMPRSLLQGTHWGGKSGPTPLFQRKIPADLEMWRLLIKLPIWQEYIPPQHIYNYLGCWIKGNRVWLIHFAVQKKLTQNCKSTMLQ